MINPVIFIPCYNAEQTISETIKSVINAIIYSERNIPVFVFDDFSKDNSYEVIKPFLQKYTFVKYIKNASNFGERRTTNLAAKNFLNDYDWMFIIHADDIVKPEWLSTIINIIEEEAVGHCFTVWSSYNSFVHKSQTYSFGDNTGSINTRHRSRDEIIDYLIKLYSNWHISGAALNLRLYDDLGGFDERMAQFGDTDFFVRGLLNNYNDIYISRTLTDYRIMPYSVSSVSFRTNRDIKEIYLLIDKHVAILRKSEKNKLIKYCVSLSSKRILKALMHLNLNVAILNVRELTHAVKVYFN